MGEGMWPHHSISPLPWQEQRNLKQSKFKEKSKTNPPKKQQTKRKPLGITLQLYLVVERLLEEHA